MDFYQDVVFKLKRYWADRGCIIQEPYDTELGAGTMSPETFLRVLGPKPYRVAYVQPSRRPADGRYGENPNRLYKHQQLQVILKPSPADVLDQYLGSLEAIGIDLSKHDIKFEEDNWEAPTLGAWGIGWQVMLDGLEITQFTYFQQCGGIDLELVPAEITYGLERLTMFLEQYWGGPGTYSEQRGHPRLRMRHLPFKVNPDARDRWLAHMRAAVDSLDLPPLAEETLWDYLQRAAFAMVNTFED